MQLPGCMNLTSALPGNDPQLPECTAGNWTPGWGPCFLHKDGVVPSIRIHPLGFCKLVSERACGKKRTNSWSNPGVHAIGLAPAVFPLQQSQKRQSLPVTGGALHSTATHELN